MADKLEQVAIRMVEQPPLYSKEPMNNPDAAIRVMNEFLSQMDRELFCIVNLQADLTPINMNIVSVGSLNEALINPREIFKSAILSNAHSMMLIHNHPSGNLTPSTSDIQTTARMQELGELMGISLVDHIITGRDGNYYSFRDKGEFPDSRIRFSTRVEDIDLTKGMVTEAIAPYEEVTDTKEQDNVRDIPTVQTATIPLPVQGKDMDSIMQSLESGVEELFTSNRYQEFLKTMAKFHNYSFNNTMLIAMQRPDATLVTSYKNWQSMGRQVMKGEKGITIIAPAPYKKMKEKEVLDENQRPIMGTDGKPKTEQVEVTVPHFKAVTVFDIAQTSGEPIQTLTPELLTAAVQDFDSFMQAIQKISPVPIRFDEIDGNANGYYHNADKEIVIKKGLSESQTLKTAIHETAHAKLHDKEIMESLGVEKDRLTKEVEAESVAYCVCSSFGLDTSDYSFPYIAGWSSSREMKEMKASMDVIRKTAGEMIDQLTEELERRFMAAVKRMKQAFNLCSSSEKFSDEDKDYIHFYCAVRSILFKLTKGDAPDIEQMNARVRKMLEGAIQSDGIEELFETGKHISVDIFSDEYMDKINAIQLPNTKIKILQRLLSQAIDEFKKVNKIMGVEFADRLKKVVDEYNNRRRDEAYANEVLDDVAEQLAQLLSELKTEKNSFKNMGVDYEEKAFYDILKTVAKKYEFEYPDDKMIELSKRIKLIVDDKSRYTDWSARDDIKANLQVDLILLLDEFGYPPVTIDDVYKEVLEQAENFKKYAQ